MTIDKTINKVKDLQEKDSLTLNEIDNNVKKILKFGTGGEVDLTEVNIGIRENTTKINEINTKIEGIDTDLTELTTKSNTINENIETIDDKVDSLLYYFSEIPKPIEFDDDPYKLDEEFSGYVSNETYNTEDSIEVTKSYTLNELSKNSYYYIVYMAVYCESNTFDLKFEIDCDMSGAGWNLIIEAHDSTIGTTETSTVSFPLDKGNNKKTILVEDINTLNGGNYVSVKVGNHSATINNFKVTLTGKNIKIINKPMKYKVFHKFKTVIISKLENNNAYTMTFDSTNMNPADLTRRYKLKVQNVRDYDEIISTYYTDKNYPIKAFNVVSYLDLDGVPFCQVDKAILRKPPSSYTAECFKLLDLAGGSSFGFVMYAVRYNDKPLMQTFSSVTASHSGSASTYTATKGIVANIAPIYRQLAAKENSSIIDFIMTEKDCTNYILFTLYGVNDKVNIGKGYNVTAYYDREDETKVNVYMKIGDKMIKKILQLGTITDDDGNETKTANILEERIIGTYDYYFETQTDVYFVVKNDQLYMFKN